MNLLKDEKGNRDYLLGVLKEDILTWLGEEINIGAEVPIPYRQMYIPLKDKIRLTIWCFKQDICFYHNLYDKDIKYADARIVTKDHRDLDVVSIRLEKDSSQKSHPVGLPYIIIETKMCNNGNTHEMLAYSEKVKLIRTIFPYCKFILLYFGEPAARVYRHSIEFDKTLYISNYDKSSIDTIKNVIKPLFREAKEIIEKVK